MKQRLEGKIGVTPGCHQWPDGEVAVPQPATSSATDAMKQASSDRIETRLTTAPLS